MCEMQKINKNSFSFLLSAEQAKIKCEDYLRNRVPPCEWAKPRLSPSARRSGLTDWLSDWHKQSQASLRAALISSTLKYYFFRCLFCHAKKTSSLLQTSVMWATNETRKTRLNDDGNSRGALRAHFLSVLVSGAHPILFSLLSHSLTRLGQQQKVYTTCLKN